MGIAKAKVETMAAIVVAARRSVSDSCTWEIPFELTRKWRDTLTKTRIIHRLHRFFKEGLGNLCNLRLFSAARPAPDRVDHNDHRRKHDDGREADVDDALNRSFRL